MNSVKRLKAQTNKQQFICITYIALPSTWFNLQHFVYQQKENNNDQKNTEGGRALISLPFMEYCLKSEEKLPEKSQLLAICQLTDG